MRILCKCGCRQTFSPSKATIFRIQRGDDVGFIKGHSFRGIHNPKWNNRRSTKDGYVLVWMPTHPNARKSGYILEHRLVMSTHLQRPLAIGEDVHHKNGHCADNTLENLELLSHALHITRHMQGMHNPRAKPPLLPKICPTCRRSFIKPWRGNHARDTFCSRQCIQGTAPKGTRHHAAKLTDDMVRAIRVRSASGESATLIAAALNLKRRNVSRIIDGTRWHHVS